MALISRARGHRFDMRLILGSGALAATAFALSVPTEKLRAHPGGVNAEGCHNNRKTGDYHCHQNRKAAPKRATQGAAGGRVHYPDCASARTAGAAPLRRGDPGYRAGLDRDNDGVACE